MTGETRAAHTCRSQTLVVDLSSDRGRADGAAAGALATPAGPVGARVLLDFLRSRTTGPTAQDDTSAAQPVDVVTRDDLHDDALDAELMERLQDMYAAALPGRLSAIAAGARAGDTVAVASAAHTLAGTSGQLGHPGVAEACRAIASDARRGVLAHARMVQLRALTGA